MKTHQFTEGQIVALLQEPEKGEKPIAALCREKGITETTLYRWRHQFGGLPVKEVARLRALEREYTRLKRLLAERDLEVDVLKHALQDSWSPLPSAASAPGRYSRAGSRSSDPDRSHSTLPSRTPYTDSARAPR